MCVPFKTQTEVEKVNFFVQEHFNSDCYIEAISGGETAQAYKIRINGQFLVFKLTPNSTDLETEKLAITKFASHLIPIPTIIETGKYDENLFYSLSTIAQGVRFDLLDRVEQQQVLPNLLTTLGHIHRIDGDINRGYGYVNPNRGLAKKSWSEFMHDSFLHRPLIEHDSAEIRNLLRSCYNDFQSLSLKLPEVHQLVHGDYGFDNAFVSNGLVSAVIDWTHCKYGDPIYDIAWLSFFGNNSDVGDLYLEHTTPKFSLENLEERERCYQIAIAIRSIDFYYNSGQKESFDWAIARLKDLRSN